MKRNRFVITLCTAILCAVSCNRIPAPAGSTFLTAMTEAPTRTVLEETSVLWQAGDRINVMTRSSHNCGPYTLTGGAGTTMGTFQGGDITSDKEYYALYPYMTGLTKQNSRYNFRISREQTWQEGSFGVGANIMEATFKDPAQPLQFRNVLGLLKLSLAGNACVYRITVSDADPESMLWGNAKLLLDGKECTANQTLELSDGDNTVSLTCPAGVQLSAIPEMFYLALPPASLSSGMTVSVYGENDLLLGQFSSSKDNTIVRSQVRAMPVRTIWQDYLLQPDGLYENDPSPWE